MSGALNNTTARTSPLIASDWGVTDNNRQARYYRITAAGRRALGKEVESWKRFAAALDSVLRTSRRCRGKDPDDLGNEHARLFHAASATAVFPLVMSVRMRGNPAALAARLPVMAASVDGRVFVQDSWPLTEWIRRGDMNLLVPAVAWAVVTALVLFLSALSIFSLVSISFSRRTREIGLRAALGANPRHVLARILSRAVALMGTGIVAGGLLLLVLVAAARPMDEVPLYAWYAGVTSAVMLVACLLACIGPARRALRINPSDALREA